MQRQLELRAPGAEDDDEREARDGEPHVRDAGGERTGRHGGGLAGGSGGTAVILRSMSHAHDDRGSPLDAALEDLFAGLVRQQEGRLYQAGRRLVPGLCLDDLLSPDDVPALRADPEFLYEDGLLAGLLAAQAAVRAFLADRRRGGAAGGPPPGSPPGAPGGAL